MTTAEPGPRTGLLAGLTARHGVVLAIAWLGWVFDIMDVFLLVLVKEPAMRELLGPGAGEGEVAFYSGLALSVTLAGWAVGGLVFGVVADRWGRTRTMALTILVYSVFTGLAGFAQTWWQLVALRFVAALGIGGEWGTGASMIAEVFPTRSRAAAAGILQSASGVGFFAATLLWWVTGENWRYAFLGGALPAFLALAVRMGLREPEAWEAARARARAGSAEGLGSLAALFGDRELRRRALVATGLSVVGICAYWGTTFWAPESLKGLLAGLGYGGAELRSRMFQGMLVVNLGALAGFLAYIPLTERIGRRWAFFWFHLGSLISAPAAFLAAHTYAEWLALFFVASAFTSGIYSGYTIMFPELFPTRLRATGASFCYNAGRIVSAPGPLLKVWFLGLFGTSAAAGAAMGGLYVLAFAFIPFLPETRGADVTGDGGHRVGGET